MSQIVHKRPQAKRDLIDCYEHIGQDRPQAAERFLVAAEDAFIQLARMPGIGQRWDSLHKHLQGVRVWPIPKFSNFLIFYRETEEGVEIVHVFHGARDIETILESENV